MSGQRYRLKWSLDCLYKTPQATPPTRSGELPAQPLADLQEQEPTDHQNRHSVSAAPGSHTPCSLRVALLSATAFGKL